MTDERPIEELVEEHKNLTTNERLRYLLQATRDISRAVRRLSYLVRDSQSRNRAKQPMYYDFAAGNWKPILHHDTELLTIQRILDAAVEEINLLENTLPSDHPTEEDTDHADPT